MRVSTIIIVLSIVILLPALGLASEVSHEELVNGLATLDAGDHGKTNFLSFAWLTIFGFLIYLAIARPHRPLNKKD